MILSLALVLAGPQLAAPDAAPSPVITSMDGFWNMPEAAKHKACSLDMELIVYYYDAGWKLLYGETAGVASYLPTTGQPLPIRSGQRVRLTGSVVPAEGLDGQKIQAAVLAEGQVPSPLSTAGRINRLTEFNGRWVEVEGYVLRQVEPDSTHIEAVVWSEGLGINATVQLSATEPVPQFTGARVRLRGVYDAVADSAGGVQVLKLWVPSRSQVELLGWLADDPRLKLPATPIEQLDQAAAQPWVRLVGQVQAQEPGVSLTVRDETAQVEIRTAQPETLPAGAAVEVIGRPATSTEGWTLQDPLFRRLEEGAAGRAGSGGAPLRLRLIEQVLQLSPEEAARRQPVTLRGVVTWYDERAREFHLQDISGGLAVSRPATGVPLSHGMAVAVRGVTQRGQLRPTVQAEVIEVSGFATPPPPRRISLDQALVGSEDGRLVEMRGMVRRSAASEGWLRLDITTTTGEFAAFLPPETPVKDLPGAIVRVRGVCVAQPGPNHEPGDIRLWVQGRDDLIVETPGSADPFAAAAMGIGQVRQLTVAQTPAVRVRVSGVVTLHRPGRYLYLQDGDAGLFVLTRETMPLAPGDAIEVSGLPGRSGNRPVLREATWRSIESRPPVPLRTLESVATLDVTLDTKLVRVAALLRQAARDDGSWRLSLEADGRAFEAMLPTPSEWSPPPAGSRLALTGVYVVEFDEYRQPHNFELLARSPADLQLLARPPWWTGRRIAYVVTGLVIAVLLAAAWVTALRRRVRQQTEQLRLQMEKEARLQAELERSARLESLGVLAGGIAHDFNNLLTAILGNLGLAAMDKRVMAAAGDCITEAERGARRARDITQQLLTFAKGGEPVRSAVPLPEIVTEAANFARHGANVRLDFDFPSNLPPGNVDAGQISRVVHNLVINAVQAMPQGGVVSLALAAVDLAAGEISTLAPGPYLRLTVADTGRGIPADVLPRIFDPYFSTKTRGGNSGLGLAAVRSIIRKHGGHIEVQSAVGQGTTFRIWLPAAPHVLPEESAGSARSAAHLPAKILVMDDEDVIRRVAGRMLALAGHETVFAPDGAEAVRTYLAARQSGRPFDLVILDLTVPGGMGGKEALEEILKADPDVRAIASSGYSSDPVMANPRAFGFRVSLPKPYDIPDLTRAVEEARRD